MADDPVDVLIIGAGAAGAAMAWSLAETRMRIVWLEQGDWVNPAPYPSNRMYPPKESPLPPVPLGRGGEMLARGFNRLGWHWWPSDSAIATRPYQGRAQCINLGPCMTGCAQGAKASTDITYWPLAVRK